MLRYVVRRLLLLVPILLGLSVLVFAWVHALPGSPADSLLGERRTPALVKAYNERYGFDQPIYVQYGKWLETTLRDRDLGVSIATHRKVSDEIRRRFPATIELTVAAMLFSIVLGIPLGFLAAKRYGGFLDNASLLLSLLGISIPIFFLAILLKYVFAVKLGWLPTVRARRGCRRERSTCGTCSATRCCRSRRSSACRRACCSRVPC
jgi:peptide/nickel transport system permease protein